MIPMVSFLHSCRLYLKEYADVNLRTSFSYTKGCGSELMDALQTSKSELLPFVLAFMEKYRTPESLLQLNHSFIPYYNDAVILTGSVDAYLAEREKEFPGQFEELISVMKNNPMMRPLFERKKKEALDSFEKEKQWFTDRKPDGQAYQEYIQNANNTKIANVKILTDLGFVF
jgi:hypothetical protein